MHKFILGQTVEYYSPRGLHAPAGIYVVTAKQHANSSSAIRLFILEYYRGLA
jgi:hypothetical protein